MKNDKTYQMLVSKMHEVSSIPVQDIGRFTPFYKRLVPYLKYSPWKSVILFSFITAVFLYILFGIRFIRLASLLQFGF